MWSAIRSNPRRLRKSEHFLVLDHKDKKVDICLDKTATSGNTTKGWRESKIGKNRFMYAVNLLKTDLQSIRVYPTRQLASLCRTRELGGILYL